jgi:predicted ATP-grasp superfamily ATP-dependent carboligase
LQTDVSIPVLILADVSLVLHHGTLGIIRSLGRLGVPVYGLIKDRFTPAAVSRYLTGAFVWQTRGLKAQEFTDGMDAIYGLLSQRAVVIPTDDFTAILVAEQSRCLEQHFVLPQQIRMLPRLLANKKELYLLCKRMGVPCPKTCFPNSTADLDDFATRADFPIMVKAAEPWLVPRGVRTTAIARTPEQLYLMYRSAIAQHTATLILQEYIAPEHGEDWFYHGYMNASSGCYVGFTGRKFRSYPPLAGPTTLATAVRNEVLRQEAESLLKSLKYSGIMDLDYRFDKRDGLYKLVDFNPRIGAQFRLFEDDTGIDVARALYFDVTGQPPSPSGRIAGRTFVAEFHDIAARFCYRRESARNKRKDWTPPFSGRRELAWFAGDDLFPFLMACIRLLLRVIERLVQTGEGRSFCSSAPRQITIIRHCLHRNAHPQ